MARGSREWKEEMRAHIKQVHAYVSQLPRVKAGKKLEGPPNALLNGKRNPAYRMYPRDAVCESESDAEYLKTESGRIQDLLALTKLAPDAESRMQSVAQRINYRPDTMEVRRMWVEIIHYYYEYSPSVLRNTAYGSSRMERILVGFSRFITEQDVYPQPLFWPSENVH